MSAEEILRTIGNGFQSSATVKNVYGDPISVGDRTVIPVARLSYAFGGGGGNRESEGAPEGGGGGGGGCMSAVPAGVIEITSEGTHFIPFQDWKRLVSVIAVSLVLGLVIGSRRTRS